MGISVSTISRTPASATCRSASFGRAGEGLFPASGGYEASTKAMASAAHTGGKLIIAAESFTSDRGWRDHPFLLKAMGDKKFCEGLNRVIFHLSAHQAYDNMIPGLTHRKWGEHINRHNTWWEYSRPWLEYLARCQYMLQQGEFVADVCYWFGEGAPLNVNDMTLELPPGYDFDFCSSDTVLQMTVKNGRLVLPSGMSYQYLRLPDTDRMTLPLARKMRELSDAGARIIGDKRFTGAPRPDRIPSLRRRGREDRRRIAPQHQPERSLRTGQARARLRGRGPAVHPPPRRRRRYLLRVAPGEPVPRSELHLPRHRQTPGTVESRNRRDPSTPGIHRERRQNHRSAPVRADAKLDYRVPEERRSRQGRGWQRTELRRTG